MIYALIVLVNGLVSVAVYALGKRRGRLLEQHKTIALADSFDDLSPVEALSLLDDARYGYGDWTKTVKDPITGTNFTLEGKTPLRLALGIHKHRKAAQLFEEVRGHLTP